MTFQYWLFRLNNAGTLSTVVLCYPILRPMNSQLGSALPTWLYFVYFYFDNPCNVDIRIIIFEVYL